MVTMHAPTHVAAAAPPPRVRSDVIAAALFILAAGAAIGAVPAYSGRAVSLTLKDGVNPFALFYILAQALERLFELLTLAWPSIGSAKTAERTVVTKHEALKERDHKLAAALNSPSPDTAASAAAEAAAAQAAVDQARLNRSLLGWTINSSLAMVGTGWLGLGLIAAITEKSTLHPVLDMLITGLVIGGGTKPLHDLISRLHTAKARAEDSRATTGK
jgi:hypothetical protein